MSDRVRQRGFTLVELLLATALSAMLMLAVLGVITSIGAHALRDSVEADPRAAADRRAVEQFVSLLSEDLEMAECVDAEQGGLMLLGYGCLDGPGRRRRHRPVLVLYRLEQLDGRRWLVRRQVSLDVLSNMSVQRDLVCRGVERFELWREGLDRLEGFGRMTGRRHGREPDAPDAGHASAGLGASVSSTVPDPNESVLFNGLMFFRRNLPTWAHDMIANGTDASGATAPAGGGSTAARETAPASAPTRRHDKTVSWRLRIWTEAEEKAEFDRVLKLSQVNG